MARVINLAALLCLPRRRGAAELRTTRRMVIRASSLVVFLISPEEYRQRRSASLHDVSAIDSWPFFIRDRGIHLACRARTAGYRCSSKTGGGCDLTSR
ncbi:hypothetical protein L798_03023 [Zootermopsis nevadensis]|uniref:Uncharacterized protein n=1 Tax=Zootermopsis nevadensis TaxID=136037 RepID=A0A067RN06_ZOONE|nr:hypothetical protein L798_03023 [Zootermopsis nevadensis]